jgi:hypothetical protein
MNRSLKHECGNWERGRAVSFLGIHESDLLCSVHSICEVTRSTCNFRKTVIPQSCEAGDKKKLKRPLSICNFLARLHPPPPPPLQTFPFIYSQIRFSQASLLISTKYFPKQNYNVLFVIKKNYDIQ